MRHYELHHGDNLTILRTMADNSVEAVVTDPPAGIGFMGKGWDSDKGGRDKWIAWLADVMREALRVTKPGGHALVWALPRTSHWTAMAVEDAGWEIRDVIDHVFGSGFPKSADVSKAIDKAAGAARAVIGKGMSGATAGMQSLGDSGIKGGAFDITAPATDLARQWEGWGTALKPAKEHWILARKPFPGTVAANVQKWGTGGINIDATRVGRAADDVSGWAESGSKAGPNLSMSGGNTERAPKPDAAGRWPPNLLLSHGACNADGCCESCPVAEMDRQSGESAAGKPREDRGSGGIWSPSSGVPAGPQYRDTGGASRFLPILSFEPADVVPFLYEAKPPTSEKEAGLGAPVGRPDERENPDAPGVNNPRNRGGKMRANTHPTPKGIALMSWLCRLITPPGGTVLDPFAGSGTTGIAALRQGFRFVGIEQDEQFVRIARRRIEEDAPLFARPAVAEPDPEVQVIEVREVQQALFGGAG